MLDFDQSKWSETDNTTTSAEQLEAMTNLSIVNHNFNVLAKARRVVVSDRLGVAKRLENRVRHENFLLHTGRGTRGGRTRGQVRQTLLGRLGLARARLAGNYDGLVLTKVQNASERVGRDLVHAVTAECTRTQKF